MTTISLSSYPRETLEHLLKMLKSYKNGLKQIGKRAVLTDPSDLPPVRAVVEYMPTMEEKDVTQYALSCIRYAFPSYMGEAPLLRPNAELKGGARVFVGDDMVDVSFQKLESFLK